MRLSPFLLAVLLVSAVFSLGSHARAADKIPILLDLDLGEALDDPFALALVLASPELDLRGVTSVGPEPRTGAMIASRFLWLSGRKEVPVAVGNALPAADGKERNPKPAISGQYQYGLRASQKYPLKDPAVEFLYAQLKASPGELTLVALGPLTNIAALFEKHPDAKPWIKRIVLMGGAVRIGYSGKEPPEPEWNIKTDVAAAKAVFAAGVPLVVAPLDATAGLVLEDARLAKFRQASGLAPRQVQALLALGDGSHPTLFDPVAVALVFEERFTKSEPLRLEIDDRGMTRAVEGKANASVATSIRRDEFLDWYLARVAVSPAAGEPRPPANPSKLIPRAGFPARVHVVEDFETDIERRWWLSGIPETKNVPPGSKRACRAVPVNDFDDKQGDALATYTGIIFNPVPGPPMGPASRLSFRYWLKGTERLRVQIYSLSNGYHRHLTLHDLPQGSWESATVDMTACRRPDGSGGPLAADERIDDIQFYTDLGAELLVDDILLYDAAVADEKRPFPRVLFTGWFDTGKQGVEWPGDFTVVPHEKPRAWKAAASVAPPGGGAERLRVSLRGPRKLGAATMLGFSYRLEGADSLQVALVSPDGQRHTIPMTRIAGGAWRETALDFGRESRGPEGRPPAAGLEVDAVDFVIPAGGRLMIDDLLLYEPGN